MSERDAARKVLEGFDKGIFVRDTMGDNFQDWLVNLLPYIRALAELREWAVPAPQEPPQ